jgi:hypothetical protein
MGPKLRALQKTAFLMNNEDGSVIIAALLVLVLLTIVGIASTNVSNTEVQIASHTTAHQMNLYRAEGATIEATTQLEAVSDPLLNPPSWVESDMDLISDQNIRDWDDLGSLSDDDVAVSSLDEDTTYIGVYTGIVSGNTLNMGSSTIHGYRIYGRSSPPHRGTAVVQIGYLMAF